MPRECKEGPAEGYLGTTCRAGVLPMMVLARACAVCPSDGEPSARGMLGQHGACRMATCRLHCSVKNTDLGSPGMCGGCAHVRSSMSGRVCW